jgi:hypothetical protein
MQIEASHLTEIDGHSYNVSISSDPQAPGTIIVDILGAGPDRAVTVEGHLAVHARSLPHVGPLLAAAFDELAGLSGTTRGSRNDRVPRRRGSGLPTNSHLPWTEELDAELRTAWQSAHPHLTVDDLAEALGAALRVDPQLMRTQFPGATPTREPAKVIAVIAHAMKRSVAAIESRLGRLGLDPALPGTAGGS